MRWPEQLGWIHQHRVAILQC